MVVEKARKAKKALKEAAKKAAAKAKEAKRLIVEKATKAKKVLKEKAKKVAAKAAQAAKWATEKAVKAANAIKNKLAGFAAKYIIPKAIKLLVKLVPQKYKGDQSLITSFSELTPNLFGRHCPSCCRKTLQRTNQTGHHRWSYLSIGSCHDACNGTTSCQEACPSSGEPAD